MDIPDYKTTLDLQEFGIEPKSGKLLIPERQYLSQDNLHHWFIFNEDQTGLPIVGLKNTDNGITTSVQLYRRDKRAPSIVAWNFMRHSRSPAAPWEIANQILLDDVDSDAKLGDTYKSEFGHASSADGAVLEMDTMNVPMWVPMATMSNEVIYVAQEKSSRFQKRFGTSILSPLRVHLPREMDQETVKFLDTKYQELGNLGQRFYAEMYSKIFEAFKRFYNVDENNKEQMSSLRSRVLDCVRFFLLLGQNTGYAFQASARIWERLDGVLGASPNLFMQAYAAQIKTMLNPGDEVENTLHFKSGAPSLVKYTKPDFIVNNNMAELDIFLRKFTDFHQVVSINTTFKGLQSQVVQKVDGVRETQKFLIQYILTLYPGADLQELINWVNTLSIQQQIEISKILFKDHTDHHELPNWAAITNDTMYMQSSFGETRDIMRQRGITRFMFMQIIYGKGMTKEKFAQILSSGFILPEYFARIPEFENLKNEFIQNLTIYYEALYEFFELVQRTIGNDAAYDFMINALPLAHLSKYFLHSNIKQDNYFPFLRHKPGGHINYIDQSYDYNNEVTGDDPLMYGMKFEEDQFDIVDPEGFFSRK